MSISSVRTSNSMIRGSSSTSCAIGAFPSDANGICEAGLLLLISLDVDPLFRADPMVFQRHLVILTERMPLPIFRTENSTQVRVAGEVDP